MFLSPVKPASFVAAIAALRIALMAILAGVTECVPGDACMLSEPNRPIESPLEKPSGAAAKALRALNMRQNIVNEKHTRKT